MRQGRDRRSRSAGRRAEGSEERKESSSHLAEEVTGEAGFLPTSRLLLTGEVETAAEAQQRQMLPARNGEAAAAAIRARRDQVQQATVREHRL